MTANTKIQKLWRRCQLTAILVILLCPTSAAQAQQYMMLPPYSVVANLTPQSKSGRAATIQELSAALGQFGSQTAVQPFLRTVPHSLLGNQGSAIGPASNIDVTSLPAKPAPAPGDIILLQDSQDGNSFKRTSAGALGSVGSVSDIAGATGSISLDGCLAMSGNELMLVSPLPSNCFAAVTSIAGARGAFTVSGLLALNSQNLEVDAASKIQQQSASSATVAVTPLHQQDHPSAAKAWVKFVGANGNINSSAYNVPGTAVTRNTAGNYTITFTTPFANSDYNCQATGFGTQGFAYFTGQSTSGVVIQFANASGAATDPQNLYVVCFGQQ